MDDIFWITSKVLWEFGNPDMLILLTLVIGTILLWFRRQKAARILLTLVTVVLLVFVFLPVDKWLLWPLENRFPQSIALPENVDGIIVLGGGEDPLVSAIRKKPQMNGAAERLIAFVSLANQYPEAKLVFTGGTGHLSLQEYKGADTAREVLKQLGFNTDRVMFESQSRNTIENVRLSHRLVQPKVGEKWILITSASHMPRSVGLFRQVEWQVIPYPVDYLTTGVLQYDWMIGGFYVIEQFNVGLREWIGCFVNWVLGNSSELFPGPK
jgi:uncharacterized SAM-binding protein YcdF (DUF218 family)